MRSQQGAYTFGDSELASERLTLLASVFEPTTRALLRRADLHRPGLAVDLGCGPGHTSTLLADVLAPRRLLAVDASPAFVTQAQARLGARGEALLGDVRELPDRVRDAEVIFARLLLTHLAEPSRALGHWLDRLRPSGVLILEEVDSITAEEPLLDAYLGVQRRMLASGGQQLDVGPTLDRAIRERATAVDSQIVDFTPPTRSAARMFAMNLATWRGRAAEAELASEDELDTLAAGLAEIAQPGEADPEAPACRPITWHLRQVIARP